MKKRTFAALALILTGIVFAEDRDPSKFLKTQNDLMISRIRDAEQEQARVTKQAQRTRIVKIRKALGAYLKAVKRVEVHWTKKGNLDKALESRAEVVKLEKALGIWRAPKKKKEESPYSRALDDIGTQMHHLKMDTEPID